MHTTSLVIANGGTASSELPYSALRNAEHITIYGPSALTGTVTVQVSPTKVAGVNDWIALQEGGSDVTVTAVKARTIKDPAFMRMRVLSGSAEGAARTFPIVMRERR